MTAKHSSCVGATCSLQAAKIQQKIEFEQRRRAGKEVAALEETLTTSQDRLAELNKVTFPDTQLDFAFATT